MTGNKLFLDSNIIIELFSGNKVIADKINDLPTFYISSIVLGELYVGINRVVNKTKHLNKLNSFLKLCIVLEVNQITARLFGEIQRPYIKKVSPYLQMIYGLPRQLNNMGLH